MNPDVKICPFCNSLLPPLTSSPTAEKIPCPRCGEFVPASKWPVNTALPQSSPSPTTSPTVPGNRKTVLILVGVMVAMAVIGLSYALWTQKLRRSRDPRIVLDPLVVRHPSQLDALGYLPKNPDILVGLHFAELLADKVNGRPLLEEPRPPQLDWLVKQVPKLSGMTLEEIDHVVVAGTIARAQLTMVIRTRRPYLLEKVVEVIRPHQSTNYLQKPLYEFSLKPAGEAMLWCVDDKTLVCVMPLESPKLEHLNDLSPTPRTMQETMAEPLREAIKERLPKQCFVWIAGDLASLDAVRGMLPLVAAGQGDFVALKDVKTFAIAIQPVEGLTMTGHFRATDTDAAEKLKDYLDGRDWSGLAHKAEAPPRNAPPWVTWQLRGDVQSFREWVGPTKK